MNLKKGTAMLQRSPHPWLIVVACATLSVAGCGGPEPEASVSTTASATPSASASALPVPSASPGGTGAESHLCDAISLTLDAGIATGYSCTEYPETTEDFLLPERAVILLEGYAGPNDRRFGSITLFPVANFVAVDPYVETHLTDLKALLGGGAPPTSQTTFGKGLPMIEPRDAGQVYFAQYALRPMQSGIGIRYLAQYAQEQVLVSSDSMSYTFQGLTDDGKYWVSAILPVGHQDFSEVLLDPPGGGTWEEFWARYDDYLEGAVEQLDRELPAGFEPSLEDLDALVASITVAP